MSDLFCAVRVILLPPAGSDPAAQDRIAAWSSTLTGERIAAVWSGDDAASVATARLIATRLGLEVRERDQLAPGTEDEGLVELVARVRAVLEEIADLHRGETVVVVGDAATTRRALDMIASRASTADTGDEGRWDLAEAIELQGDSDGWVIRRGDPER